MTTVVTKPTMYELTEVQHQIIQRAANGDLRYAILSPRHGDSSEIKARLESQQKAMTGLVSIGLMEDISDRLDRNSANWRRPFRDHRYYLITEAGMRMFLDSEEGCAN